MISTITTLAGSNVLHWFDIHRKIKLKMFTQSANIFYKDVVFDGLASAVNQLKESLVKATCYIASRLASVH